GAAVLRQLGLHQRRPRARRHPAAHPALDDRAGAGRRSLRARAAARLAHRLRAGGDPGGRNRRPHHGHLHDRPQDGDARPGRRAGRARRRPRGALHLHGRARRVPLRARGGLAGAGGGGRNDRLLRPGDRRGVLDGVAGDPPRGRRAARARPRTVPDVPQRRHPPRRNPLPAERPRLASCPPPPARARSGMTLALSGVSRAFGGVRAVDDDSFTVADGEVHGLIGPNGAGKTTLLNMVSGLLRPTSGRIELDGRRIDGLPPNRIASYGVARTYQNIRLFAGLSAADNVVVGQHLQRRAPFWKRLFLLPSARKEEASARQAAEAGLQRVGMRERATTRAFNLSYGEQRRVEIARALAAQPKLVLLDEPTAGMNPNEAAAVARLVREVAKEGRAVLLIEHNVRLVMELCDRITVLNFGKVIARGTPAEVGKDPAVIAAYLGDGA